MRVGISAEAPAGTHWVRLAGSMRQIEIYENDEATVLWGVHSQPGSNQFDQNPVFSQLGLYFYIFSLVFNLMSK